MRYRIRPSREVASEIKGFDKKDLVELMRRAAIRMSEGDKDEHIERSVAWEGHSEEFARWLVREVRASFDAYGGVSNQPQTTLELVARTTSRLAVLLVLVLFGVIIDREAGPAKILLLIPIIFLGFLYGLGFLMASARLVNRLFGLDKQSEDDDAGSR